MQVIVRPLRLAVTVESSTVKIVKLGVGLQGPAGATGATGPQGDPGEGVPSGGTTGQLLAKNSNTNYDTEWIDPPNSAVWGGITGTLSNQTDLQNALNGKENTGVAAGLVSAHEAALDPHSQYTTNAEAQAIADAKVSDVAYDATSWDSVTTVAPSKNAVRDKIESLVTAISSKIDLATYSQYEGF